MKKIFILIIIATCFLLSLTKAQNTFPKSGKVGIFTTSPNASAALDIDTTGLGLLIPRMTKNQRDAIASPATGLLIFQTNSTPGFYYYDGSTWKGIAGSKGVNKSLNNLTATAINQSLVPDTTNFLDIGSVTTYWRNAFFSGSLYVHGITIGKGFHDYDDNTALGVQSLGVNVNGSGNTAVGYRTLFSNTSGTYNTATGTDAMGTNSTGNSNSAVGNSALKANTSGSENTALGFKTLAKNQTGFKNIAIGSNALANNLQGHDLIAIGDSALYNQVNNNNGYYYNVAIGSKAMYSNIDGFFNVANGYNSLFSNTHGAHNTSSGFYAAYLNTTGSYNTASGDVAMYSNTTGNYNVSSGYISLYSNTTGSANTAIGSLAMQSNIGGSYNSAFGDVALYSNSTGSYLSCFGYYANTNQDGLTNSTAIGSSTTITASNQVRVGNSSVTSIGGQVSWSTLSDGRAKKNIKQNVPGLAFINKLNPVTYNLNLDAVDNIIQPAFLKDEKGIAVKPSQEELVSRKAKEQVVYTGLIAQDVEKAAKETGYNFSGVDAAKNDKDLYGLRYSDFVMPLIKAVQELSKLVDDRDEKINNLQKQIDDLKAIVLNKQSISNSTSNQVSISSMDNNKTSYLKQNTPNPYKQNTVINYYLQSNTNTASINFYNAGGVLIKSVKLNAKGNGSINFNASGLAAGTYSFSLITDGKIVDSKQMVVTR